MKKITLALCACAFALTGLLASCSSGSKDFINYSTSSAEYKYAVNGTIVNTNSSSSEDSSKKVSANTSTTTTKIDGGFVTVKWNENENRESNFTSYSVEGTVKSSSTVTSSRTYDDKALDNYTSSSNVGTTNLAFDISDVDGTMYFNLTESEIVDWENDYDNWISGYTLEAGWYPKTSVNTLTERELSFTRPYSTQPDYDWAGDSTADKSDYTWKNAKKVEGCWGTKPVYGNKVKKTFKMDDIAASEDDDAFSGDFGKEFSINIKITSKDENLNYTKENTTKATNAGSVEYKLTFVPVEDYDPEDFVED